MKRHLLVIPRVSIKRLLCVIGLLFLTAPVTYGDAVSFDDGMAVSMAQDPLSQDEQDAPESGSKCTLLSRPFRVVGVPLWFKLSLGALPAVTILGLERADIRINDSGSNVPFITGILPSPDPAPASVPEPATLLLLGAGLAGVIGTARRWRASATVR